MAKPKTPEEKAAAAAAAAEKKAAAAAAAADKVEKGNTLLVAPEDCTSFSHDGEEYEVDEEGLVEVPDAVAVELISHGFKKAK